MKTYIVQIEICDSKPPVTPIKGFGLLNKDHFNSCVGGPRCVLFNDTVNGEDYTASVVGE